jgi:hypothetical protein
LSSLLLLLLLLLPWSALHAAAVVGAALEWNLHARGHCWSAA